MPGEILAKLADDVIDRGRSLRGLRVRKSRPAFPELALLPPPMRDMKASTAGFFETMSAALCWCSIIVSNAMSLLGLRRDHDPTGVLVGEEALGSVDEHPDSHQRPSRGPARGAPPACDAAPSAGVFS